MAVCTRFAPSPTGVLHIGSARTALFAWLFAKHHQGQFVLRIEDTDRERSTQASVDAIFEGMNWLGLETDLGPYYQTERFDRYQEVIKQLLDTGHAYRCICSKERLEALRETQMQQKQKPRYDGCCRNQEVDANQPHVIRFKNPTDGQVCFDDAVKGTITIQNAELDDLIIARTDGTPTYNLTVVVDDLDMNISHAIRGDDHINNTPRQINIFLALEAPVPTFAHIPMILGADGKRLSKRHGATGVMEYQQEGFLPEAVLNYLVRLGWSHGDQEIFSVDEMIEKFNLESINQSAAALNPDKLIWLNQHYIKTVSAERLTECVLPYLFQLGITKDQLAKGPELSEVLEIQRERAKTLVEMAEKSAFFYQDVTSYDEKANKHLTEENLVALKDFAEQLAILETWQPEPIHELVKATAEKFELKMGKVAQPIRIALSGGTVSPPIDATIFLMGRELTLKRIQALLSNKNRSYTT